jgi:uncharacterized OB-fold protein
MTTSERPLPQSDEMSAPYWEAAARHLLTAARCSTCGTFNHPPDGVCMACGSTTPRFVFTPIGGTGIIRSWTVVRQSFLPGFDALIPYLLVDVELDEQPGLRLVARLLGAAESDLHIGDRVRTTFEDIAIGVAVPAFELDEAP